MGGGRGVSGGSGGSRGVTAKASGAAGPAARPDSSGASGGSRLTSGAPSRLGQVTEFHLMERIFDGCDRLMRMACAFSSVPVAFLAGLVANESGGDARAMRFEPAVYDHLAAVAQGGRPAYGAIGQKALEAEIEDALHPKSDSYHAHFLTASFAERSASALGETPDEALRELATSWGYTQIMGYHMIWRGGEARDLLDPDFHFSMALELVAQFAESYQLDVRCEFRELFGCWNTGRPYGETTDPRYVENGLRRMAIYRQVEEARSRESGAGVPGQKLD